MSKTTFIDGSYSTGVVGTRITATLFNKLNSQRHTGRDIDGEGALDYAVTGGSSNAYAVNLMPALDAYITGMPFYFKASFTNTGAATMNINGLGAISLKKNLSDDLIAGDIVSGQLYVGMYDGTNIIVINMPRVAAAKSNFPDNYGLAASVSSNALTISRKGANGNDPSSGNVVTVPFRNPTLTLGFPLWVQYVAATSITLPQGSTLGYAASESGRFYVYEGTDGTNTDMGIIRQAIVPEDSLFSSTAMSSSATSTTTLYSASARSNWVWRCVGYIEATMGSMLGNWASYEKVQIMGPGIHRTGDVIQRVEKKDTTTATSTATTYVDSPLSKQITLTSSTNKVMVEGTIKLSASTYIIGARAQLVRDSTILADPIAIVDTANYSADVGDNHSFCDIDTPSSSSPNYKVQYKTSSGTVFYNSGSGGVSGMGCSVLILTEVFA